MAVVSDRVVADVIEANEFLDLSSRYQVSGVPKIVINDTVALLGAQREPRLLQAVLAALEPKPSEESGGAPGS